MKDESYGSTLLSVKIEKNKTKVIIWYMSYIPILVTVFFRRLVGIFFSEAEHPTYRFDWLV